MTRAYSIPKDSILTLGVNGIQLRPSKNAKGAKDTDNTYWIDGNSLHIKSSTSGTFALTVKSPDQVVLHDLGQVTLAGDSTIVKLDSPVVPEGRMRLTKTQWKRLLHDREMLKSIEKSLTGKQSNTASGRVDYLNKLQVHDRLTAKIAELEAYGRSHAADIK